MKLTIEISMYPFDKDYKGLVKDFIKRLNEFKGLKVATSATSTIVNGEYSKVMEMLDEILAWSHQVHGRSVFMVKFIPGHKLK